VAAAATTTDAAAAAATPATEEAVEMDESATKDEAPAIVGVEGVLARIDGCKKSTAGDAAMVSAPAPAASIRADWHLRALRSILLWTTGMANKGLD